MKRRKRRVRFGSSPAEHQKDAEQYFRFAEKSIELVERGGNSCRTDFETLVDAERSLARAISHRQSAKATDKSRAKELDARLDAVEEQFKQGCMK